jgi:rod shape-determining protein MreD
MAATAWSREGGLVRFALGLLIPLAAALLQGTVAPLIALGDARPVLPLLVAGCWAIAAGAREAIWWAFFGGLVADLLSGGPLGAFALASLAPIAAIGVQDRGLGRSTPVLVAALLVAAATLVALLSYLGIVLLTQQPVASVPQAAGAAAASALYTGVLALPIYPVARLLRRVTERQGALGVW